MTIEDIIKPILKVREGFSLKVYKDSRGFDTIYYGHKVVPGKPISEHRRTRTLILKKILMLRKMRPVLSFPNLNHFRYHDRPRSSC